MIAGKYFFNGKDLTMNFCIQVLDVIMDRTGMTFPDAIVAFYHSKMYETLQNTENTLWTENAEYIADRYFEEGDNV